ncbi:hypothetical protein LPJ66_001349 [Kickxella alabastrina]|uniref:Uncharacterized protein n=1 Tax=Kickxella alabastrina TaxID=61397 RepID=A0ACC1ITH6_9FUNG|nr:hypothetical protein LPJ66_001349 [Kickxella alabastrina]
MVTAAPSILGVSAGSRMRAISRRNATASLIATVLSDNAYSDDCISWTTSSFSWCLSQTSDTALRLVAWSLFPLFCLRTGFYGMDGFSAVAGGSRVTVGDPDELLEVVGNSIGYVACARSGCLHLRSAAVSACLKWGMGEGPVPVVSYTSGMASIYGCFACDPQYGSDISQAADKRLHRAVSLSSWVPYWFIASGNLRKDTSVQFVRGVSRFVRHAAAEDIGLHASPLGRGIIRRLSSNDREMRLAAVDAILAYSCAHPGDSEQISQIKRANRMETMGTLHGLVRELHSPSIVEETLELAAGGLGCACQLYDDALGEVMSFLMGYYCDDNVFLRAVAMEQVLRIAKEQMISPARLLALHAGSITCTLANILDQQSPRPFVHCMSILKTTPQQFLSAHQDTVVPHLVATGNEKALRNVADILEVRLPVLCVNQAPTVFVKIFLMDDQLMHQALLRFVRLISAGSGSDGKQDEVEVNIPSLLRSCSVKLIFNLVLSLGEEDNVLRKRARSALLTVQSILGSSASDEQQGVTTIVQRSVSNLKDVSSTESPKPGKQAGQSAASAELAAFLSQHILGVMAYVNELLRDSDSCTSDAARQGSRAKHKALRAIGELVTLLGSRSTPHTNNIVASLTPSLQGPLCTPALHSWVVLAKNLSKVSLSVDQVNALLVPLITAFLASGDAEVRSGTASAINSVVARHRHNIDTHIERVCPIPDDPLLASARAILQGFFSGAALRERLSSLTQMLKTKDSTIVLCASRELCTMLQQHDEQVIAWKQMFVQKGSSPNTHRDSSNGGRFRDRSNVAADVRLLNSVIETLRAACSHANTAHRLGELASASCAACLAVIGVVDSRALENKSRSDGSDMARPAVSVGHNQPALYNLHDKDEQVEFVCTLIVDYLTHAFAMAPSPSVQTCAAYSIQELLRLAGFTKELIFGDTDNGSADNELLTAENARKKRETAKRTLRDKAYAEQLKQRWDVLPSNVVEVIKPLLNSKYTIQSSGRKTAEFDRSARVPCIARSANHIVWLRSWMVEITNALPDLSPAARMFKVCTSAMKESSADMLLFLLPQIAYQYCLYTSSKATGAGRSADKEKPIVIEDDEDDKDAMDVDSKDSVLGYIIVDEINAVFSLDSSSISLPGDQWRLCKEVGLDLLDTFASHVRVMQMTRVKDKRSTRKDSRLVNMTAEERALLALVSSVSHGTIARVAMSCHQYERAMLHTELALRENSLGKFSTLFGNVDDSVMATIQELYFGMGDVDSVIGVSLCRKQTDYKLDIRKYEIEGNWSHALIGHESLLRAQPENEDYQRSWISCLQNMGQWEGAWSTSRELFRPSPRNEDEQQLNSACFAAAWRLGKWDWVEDTVQSGTIAESLGSHQPLPEFNALNSAMLLRLSREQRSGDTCNLKLPLPLRAFVLGQDSGRGILRGPFANLANLALASIGHGVAHTAALRSSVLGSSQVATSASKAPSEVYAHMLGDIAIMTSHLGGMDGYNCDCEEYSEKLGDLFEQWRRRVLCLPEAYSVQEPILMLHSRLYDILLSRMEASGNHGHCLRSGGTNGCACAEMTMRQKVCTNLQAAQLARMAGFRATSMGILVHAELTCSATPALQALIQTEHARILWDEGHTADAMSSLIHVTNSLNEQLKLPSLTVSISDTPTVKSTMPLSSGPTRKKEGELLTDVENAFVKAMMPLLGWQTATNSAPPSVLVGRYEQIINIHDSAKAFYAMGRLNDVLFSAMDSKMMTRVLKEKETENHEKKRLMLQLCLLRYYCRSILCSSRFLFQALPRLLTVWFEFSNTSGPIPEKPDPKRMTAGVIAKQIDSLITNMTNRLPTHNFLIVLSQLVSRICHDNMDVFKHLQKIILQLLEMFPQQTLWQLMGVQRSTFAVRAQRCHMILEMAKTIPGPMDMAGGGRGPHKVGTLIEQASKLTDLLLNLSNATPTPQSSLVMQMSKDFPMLAKYTSLDIIIPLQQSMVPTLDDVTRNPEFELALSSVVAGEPHSQRNGSALSGSQHAMIHQPFSGDLPTISSFANEIEVMLSLQRPKKITIIGSNGKRYSFLCKPKDDLRKDSRLMEFNSMINKLLSAGTETHKRGLHIRTYAVVPLNEECGLIQWISPTIGIRQILSKLYKAHNVVVGTERIKEILRTPSTTSPFAETFTKKLLPLFPSVMHEWYLQSFPDPLCWLASRTNFTRSAAVMSMVGYILGLGDRHCENILIDESTGGVVHVDFNCLFEKGLKLDKPERVPFRLTHNMVDAMGVTGYEGMFRKTCEMTLSLLRENRDSLMSVLEAFLHDPLVEWSKPVTRASRTAAANKESGLQQPNAEATRSLAIISRKLQGTHQSMTPLSVEGHVDALIREATSPERLFQMYIGWSAYT